VSTIRFAYPTICSIMVQISVTRNKSMFRRIGIARVHRVTHATQVCLPNHAWLARLGRKASMAGASPAIAVHVRMIRKAFHRVVQVPSLL
jgi:hypothetical protein